MMRAIACATIAFCAALFGNAYAEPPAGVGNVIWVRIDAPPISRIEFINGFAGGFAGCESWTADVTFAGERVAFSNLRRQPMRANECRLNAAVQNDLIDVIGKTRAVRLDGEALLLLSGADETLARFVTTETLRNRGVRSEKGGLY